MISHFYDSSSFVKLFVSEQGTAEMLRQYAAAERRVVSRITFVEAHAATVRLERDGDITSEHAAEARKLIREGS